MAEELGNVSKDCKMMGLLRDTFYRYKSAVDEGGVNSLFEQNRRKPNVKNRVDEKTEAVVNEYAVAFPAHGQHRASNELRKQGTFVSGSGVRSIWVRNNLSNFKQRLKALESKVAEEAIILTESQIIALEKKKHDDESCGEIETSHPGYLGSQDTFYVGTLKGVAHTRTKVRSSQTNGICERFHKTILQEFYQITFRKKIYSDIETLQKDLDEWIYFYNNQRTHQGKMCNGRTPLDTLTEDKEIWKEKFIA